MGVLTGLEPRRVFEIFEEICTIPHGSGNMDRISKYCVDFAQSRNLPCRRDKLNNVVITKPASEDYENHPAVILQGHLDMVCEKEPDCPINFLTDGLDLMQDGEYIFAKGTTLGGDDGIAVAMILAILEDTSLPHPPIYAVFTTDEETGMFGADALDVSDIDSKTLINIDSENEGVLTVSCAGGARAEISIPLGEKTEKRHCYKATVCGLMGGHSGVEIDKGRLNSNIAMGSFLKFLGSSVRISDIHGGLKDNAIPVLTECVLATDKDIYALAKVFSRERYVATDPNLKIEIEEIGEEFVYSKEDSCRIVDFLRTVPNGIIAMSEDIKGLVQTSLNLGILYCEGVNLKASFAVRSSVGAEKNDLLQRLCRIAEDFGGEYSSHGHYPAWEYMQDSRLRRTMVSVYEMLYGQEPIVEAIHAGLECGLFCEKIDGLDAVSFGPDMCDIHTPKERLSIESTRRTYAYLLAVLKSL